MTVLGFDTSFLSGTSVGVRLPDGREFERSASRPGTGQQQNLMPMIDAALNDAGVSVRDADLIAVGAGPGSFTGIRIGISTAKGLAWARGVRTVGLSSLELLARTAARRYPQDLVVPVVDARMNRVFAAFFRRGKRDSDDMDIEPDRLSEMIRRESPGGVLLVGDGLARYGEKFAGIPGVVLDGELMISGRVICEAALEYANTHPGFDGDPRGLKPVYLRLSEAESRMLEVPRSPGMA